MPRSPRVMRGSPRVMPGGPRVMPGSPHVMPGSHRVMPGRTFVMARMCFGGALRSSVMSRRSLAVSRLSYRRETSRCVMAWVSATPAWRSDSRGRRSCGLFDLILCHKAIVHHQLRRKNPHPNPLPEYRARGRNAELFLHDHKAWHAACRQERWRARARTSARLVQTREFDQTTCTLRPTRRLRLII